jgi:transcriptional regulator with XRE-family HTH domain
MDRTDLLRELINSTGLSMRAFSEKAGIPNTTLFSMLERGIGKAAVDNVIKVCKALGITVEQLEEMAKKDSLVPLHRKEDKTSSQFATAKEATEYLLKIPSMAAYGGYDIKQMTDEEIIEFANELLHQFELISHKYKK